MSYNYHGIYDFSDREIDQICFLVKRWACGDAWVPVDARRFTKQVKEWAKNYNLLEMRDLRLCLTHCLSWYNVSHTIFLIQSLPIEVTWRLVEPMLNVDGSTGYSIVNSEHSAPLKCSSLSHFSNGGNYLEHLSRYGKRCKTGLKTSTIRLPS